MIAIFFAFMSFLSGALNTFVHPIYALHAMRVPAEKKPTMAAKYTDEPSSRL
jgi:hypothetical protein